MSELCIHYLAASIIIFPFFSCKICHAQRCIQTNKCRVACMSNLAINKFVCPVPLPINENIVIMNFLLYATIFVLNMIHAMKTIFK